MKPLRARPGAPTLQAQFLWATVLVIVLLMVAVIVVVDHRQRAIIVDEFQRRGEALARSLASISYQPLRVHDVTALEQNVARLAAEADVAYAVVLDASGRVAADSRGPRLGSAGPASIDDFTVPVIVDGRARGTARVGLSRGRPDAEIRRTRLELGALTLAVLLLGGAAAALVARRIARPMRQLAESAAAISRGDLNQRIEPSTSDEIGQLAVAFNHMATELFQQRAALEEAHAELCARFEELADIKRYTDNILASLTSGIVTVDLDGRVVTLNPAAELLTGFFRGEAVGRYCTEIFANTPEVGDLLMETLASRAPITSVPLTLRRRNGASLPVEFHTAPLKGGEGKDLGAIAMFRDVTFVRHLESQLRRSDRLAALGTLAAGLAHEIKNPLTSLLTFGRHLERKLDDAGFREKFQRVVPRELERINSIVERLLELARPGRLHFTLVRLPPLLERVLDLYANEIEAKRIRVLREYARDLPPIQADAELLYRALVNLVVNGLEAMEPGGRLTLRASWDDVGGRLARAGRRMRRAVRVEIEDTGAGISMADGDRVFNPFFSTKEWGTGLGLALTHKIVEDHGGAISFRSAPGCGTTFTIVLPLVPEPRTDGEDGEGA